MDGVRHHIGSLLFFLFLGLLSPPVVAELRVNFPWSEKLFQQLEREYGEMPARRVRALYNMVAEHGRKPLREKLERVNDFFHLWRVTDDMLVWGERDHWATLLEFIVKFQGDSEDIALAKLVMLELMGVPRKNLYLGYVKQGKTSTPLMVLVWVSDDRSETLVLDHVDKSIRPGKERKDLQAIYLVNAEGHVILLKDEGGAREIVKESTDSAIHKLAAVFSRMGENRKNYQRFNDARPLFVSTDP